MNPPQLEAQLDAQRRKVDVEHFDLTVRELHRMATQGELSIAPQYQRKFRWSEQAESKLIESIFLGLPVPSLFFASNRDGTWEVVDGLQRISTLIHFLSASEDELGLIKKKEQLRIGGLDKLTALNEKKMPEIADSARLLFLKRALRVTVLSDKSDFEVRFDTFERLNTGGVVLTPQEVRVCIFRGPFMDTIEELAGLESFNKLVKLQRRHEEDGTREEVVLKFFAYLYYRHEFDGKVALFLNRYAKEMTTNYVAFNARKSKKLFVEACDFLYSIVKGPFLRSNVSTTPLNQLEAVLIGLGEIYKAGKKPKHPTRGWRDDKTLIESSSAGTNTMSRLNKRINRSVELFS